MNVEKYTNGEGELFVIMRTVTNSASYIKSGENPNSYSFFNIRGVFDKLGTPELPILTWSDRTSAEIALIGMTKKLLSDKVLTINESGCYLGIDLIGFCEQHELALTRYLNAIPFIYAEARRLNEEKILKKIYFHATKLLELANAKSDEILVIQKRITSQNPGWSIFSAATSLLGEKSMNLIGRMKETGATKIADLTIEQLEQAITIAKNFLKNRENKR